MISIKKTGIEIVLSIIILFLVNLITKFMKSKYDGPDSKLNLLKFAQFKMKMSKEYKLQYILTITSNIIISNVIFNFMPMKNWYLKSALNTGVAFLIFKILGKNFMNKVNKSDSDDNKKILGSYNYTLNNITSTTTMIIFQLLLSTLTVLSSKIILPMISSNEDE